MKRLTILIAVCAIVGSFIQAGAGELPQMTVWKSPWCGCCTAWVQHMKDAGFKVEIKEVEDLGQVKRAAGIPEALQSCHTATVGGYAIEGHVPATDVKRLLTARPDIDGLAVPGMPSGSPGMENGQRDPYDVVTFKRGSQTKVFKHYD
ncbi:MAG: DUF411 domain-containing protein [Hyphomicrobiales bacterium]